MVVAFQPLSSAVLMLCYLYFFLWFCQVKENVKIRIVEVRRAYQLVPLQPLFLCYAIFIQIRIKTLAFQPLFLCYAIFIRIQTLALQPLFLFL